MKAVTDLMGRVSWMSQQDMKMLAGPILIILILSMMILPLPPFALDVFFTFNIALSMMVLLVSMYTKKPLDFAAFPAILLFTTLLRLSLNVASTRVVLMHGHEGPGAAGKVIEAFSHFLVGGNFAVGLAVFFIFVIINFMVITKGAGRIAEVGARFTLDAMPGKQMAIDADLNAGLIGEDEARKRRKEISQEADFFGAMDGANKFVRGDAVAGLVIMAVNIVGGLLIGMLQHDMPFSSAGETYVLLTIGDGLVAQIPALLISVAAAVTVSRVNTEEDVGEQMMGQMFKSHRVLMIAGAVIGMLGLIPGMPNFIFLLFAAVLCGGGWLMMKREQEKLVESVEGAPTAAAMKESPDASWDDVRLLDSLELAVGFRLIPLIDPRKQGELITRIKGVRKTFAEDVGFLPPVVHMTDSLELDPNSYVIRLNGVEVGRGETFPGKWLAIDPGYVTGTLDGEVTTDPAYDMPAVWIETGKREHAQVFGYTVSDASTVVAVHLSKLMHQHASSMLGRDEVQHLLDKLGAANKALVDEVVPKLVSLSNLKRILGNLLDEDVSIRDMRTILDAIAENAALSQGDPQELAAMVRVALGRAITQQWFPGQRELHVIGLDIGLEQVLMQAVSNGGSLEPGLASNLMEQAEVALARQEGSGEPPVLVVPHKLRPLLSRFLRRRMHHLVVMSLAEIPDDRTLRVTSMIGATN